MLRRIDNRTMGKGSLGWLESWYHFSFANYYHPQNINYGALRVLNDDLIDPGTGFSPHPHKDMEILTYVVAGELTHEDSMQNRQTLRRGEVQYMSAGTGIIHSEYNLGADPLRLLQIWIVPDRTHYQPRYGDYRFAWGDRIDRFLPIASGPGGSAPIRLHQDCTVLATALSAGKSLRYEHIAGRQFYLVQIEGASDVNGVSLSARDALEARGESLHLTASADGSAHLLLFDLAEEIPADRT